MEAQLSWLDDPMVYRVNALEAHSDHSFYASEKEVVNHNSSLKHNLSGEWLFHYADNPMQRIKKFYQQGFNLASFDKISVPSHIELNDYASNQYINIQYPWSAKVQRSFDKKGSLKNSFSKGEDNSVGEYARYFDLPQSFIGKRTHIIFKGAERSIYLWLNGHFIGYTEDSFAPHEFDLTPYLEDKNNYLAVEVFKYSTAAYLEDQDMFSFFGLFRDVELVAWPDTHLVDLFLHPKLSVQEQEGLLTCDLKFSGDISRHLRCELYDTDNRLINCQSCLIKQEQISVDFGRISAVKVWDNHHPSLYRVVFKVYGLNEKIEEIVHYEFGFRKIRINEENIVQLNGQRLIINGVNRHEWSAKKGRAISSKEMREDIQTFRDNYINAVRTCHYMDQDYWYFLCDHYGIYVMAENNLETHGTWVGGHPEENLPGSGELWRGMALDRAKSNFEWLKNHSSILMWSLGNESYAGDNLMLMDQFYHTHDSERLVHYEGVSRNPIYRSRISDFESGMYMSPDKASEYLQQGPDKPLIFCEYMHSMGNSVGGLGQYISLIQKYPQDCGGFIWDFIDQALYARDEISGQNILKYGGDFDDRPNDGAFSGDGLLFADRTPKPAMQEVRYYYQKLDQLNYKRELP